MYLQRIINLPSLLSKKSFFLLGPRSTGKTKLINRQLGESSLIINLLKSDVYLKLSNEPWLLADIINSKLLNKKIVVIDEIQKIPLLLNEVHNLIESTDLKFLLTGSSARKLKRGGVNLLAGRAWRAEMFPLTYREIPNFSLEKYLLYGGLPQVVTSEDPIEELIAYVHTYLTEEIKAEAEVRKIQSFGKFIQTAAVSNGTIINYSSISSDTGVPATTIREYYQLLEDTLVGFKLNAWTKSIKRKAITKSKFFFFDIGVSNQLAQIEHIPLKTELFGNAFEHFIIMELRAYISYTRKKLTLSYWQSKHGQEVDVLIGDDIAIEIKSTTVVSDKHLKGLKILMEEEICTKYYLISRDKVCRDSSNIMLRHWQDFLDDLWDDKVVLS